MSDGPSKSQLLIYQSDDGTIKIDVRFENETVWLTQPLIAELFQTSVPNVSMHVKNIFEEGELAPEATVKDFLTVRLEGARQVSRSLEYYNLDAIISVGYRVKSRVATSREQADELAHEHYARFEQRRRTAAELEAEEEAVKQLTETAKKLPTSKVPTGHPHISPGQRPGSDTTKKSRALKGRDKGGRG
jgi:hypothetical protein